MSAIKNEMQNVAEEVESLYRDADKEKFYLTAEEERELLEHPLMAGALYEDKLFKIEW